MANLAIKGHSTRGNEVIKILEMLDGENKAHFKGTDTTLVYYIHPDGYIDTLYAASDKHYKVFTLEEFLEKFPYKIRDKVTHSDYESPLEIVGMTWENDSIKYEVYTNDYGYWFSVDELQPYKEETMDEVNKAVFDANAQCCDIMNHIINGKAMEEIKIDIPKGYEFAGVDDDNQQVVFTKIQPKYPKTYRECAKIVEFNIEEEPTNFGYKEELLDKFQKLLICRDAYWKIAGDWKPDWKNGLSKFCIAVCENQILSSTYVYVNFILAFPSEEMRDAFYENFKDLIEECKELL